MPSTDRPRNIPLVMIMGATFALTACAPDPSPQRHVSIALNECRVPAVSTAVKCATYDVFENRESKTGRKIGLNIVIYPASARSKEPDPIFVFAGGPGQAATDVIEAVVPLLSGLTTKRDVVFIDQRGTGKSNLLNCKFPDDESPEMASEASRRALTLKMVAACRDELAQRADLTQYGSTTAMADYDEVRAALGYDKINLWGGSYGTRTAQEYLRRYPDHVRSVILDGVASPSMALPASFARDASTVLESAFKACETQPACHKNYPDLRKGFAALLDRLDKKPARLAVQDPLTNIAREVTISRQSVTTQVFSMLYAPQLVAVLPEVLKQADTGNFAPLFAATGGFIEFAEDKIAFGMRLSVSCNEDVPRIDAAARAAADKLYPFQSSFIREFSNACAGWPKGKVADDFHTPVRSGKPVLIFSGGLDPVTPQIFGDEVKKTFSNSVHLIAPNIGHGVASHGCAPKLMKQFVEKASVDGLDGECLKRIPRPSYFQAMVEKPKKTSERESNSGDKP